VTLQNATPLTGAFTAQGTSNVALLGQSVGNMTANSNVTNLTNTASTIGFTPPTGGAFKTLTAVSYVGTAAPSAWMNAHSSSRRACRYRAPDRSMRDIRPRCSGERGGAGR
jgi:hypothetical protein